MKQLRLLIGMLFLSCLFILNGCSSGGGDLSKPPAPTPGNVAITAYSINGATGIIAGNNITVTLPYGTNVTALAATFTAIGADAFVGKTHQVSGVTINNFTNPVVYTLVPLSTSSTTSTQNASPVTYTVTVIVASNSEKAINSFSLSTTPGNIGTPGVITGQNISVVIPYGTPVTALIATYTTTGASVLVGGTTQKSGVTSNNFTNPVSYVVTAADGTTATYTVTVTIAPDSNKAITAFSLNGTPGIITGQNIAVTMPFGTSLSDLVATFTTSGIKVSVNGVTQISDDTHNNFTSPVSYVVTAADGTTATYIVTVTNAANSSKAITAFSLNGYSGIIIESAKTITVNVPYGTPITSMTASYTQTGEAVLVNNESQISGIYAPHNFTTPVTYVVRAADNSTANYAVSVIVAASSAKDLTSFILGGNTGVFTGESISVTLLAGTNVTQLIATFITTGVNVSVNGITQTSTQTPNNFTNPVSYVVKAADNSTKTYIVTISFVNNQWVWFGGSNTRNQNGVYGTKGFASLDNIPGARSASISWADTSGNLWLFGGYASLEGLGTAYLNDLWKYNTLSGEWTWISGSNIPDESGIYGTQGTGSEFNIPGARNGSISWMDSSNNLWLFGGNGYDESGNIGTLSDLWKFNPGTGEWTWVNGYTTINHNGIYGTQGTGSESNIPGGRNGSTSWTNAPNNFWLFGGNGYDESGNIDYLSDLWKFNPGTREWTWVNGYTTINHNGIYGTQGIGSESNIPGARHSASTWVDTSGNLWLFGGVGFGEVNNYASNLNDLWKFNPGTGEWTWVSGSKELNQPSVYGTKGIGSESNIPGGRYGASTWIDNSGNLWLFGGQDDYYHNDLWKFNPGNREWTWVGGEDQLNPQGVYGTLYVAESSNMPGSRYQAVSWHDASDNFWLFGGFGYPAGPRGYLNDLWKYHP